MPLPIVAAAAAPAAVSMTAPLVAGGLAAAGSIGASLIGAHSSKSQMKFQERMSNTSHVREMADLRRAGLNPLLTGKYGGSSTPQGTSFTPENPLGKAAESGMNMKMLQANLKNIQQTVLTNSALEGKYYEETALQNEKWQTEKTARKLLELQINEAKSSSDLYKQIGELGKGAEKGKGILPFLLKLYMSTKTTTKIK